MAGDDLKKVARGQALRIPAAAYNSFIDAAVDYRNRTVGIEGEYKQRDTRNGVIFVRNDSGGDLEQFEVLGIDEIVIGPEDNEREFRNRTVLAGVTPDETEHRGRFVIVAEPIAPGKIGRAYIDGVTPVKLDVPDEENEPRFAEMDDGQTGNLKAMTVGSASILWREGGTGVQWAVVRIGQAPILFPVELEKSGGEQGDDENPATWTYDVKDVFTGETLEEGVDPTEEPHKWQRPSVGQMIEATFGYAHYNADGDLALGWINEMVDQESCEESSGSS